MVSAKQDSSLTGHSDKCTACGAVARSATDARAMHLTTGGYICHECYVKRHTVQPYLGAEKPDYPDVRSATEVCAQITHEPHSTDVWSTARALNVLRESLFKDDQITCKVLEDAARYLGEFGEIRNRAEMLNRREYNDVLTERARADGRRHILNTEVYREGERRFQEHEAAQRKNEKRRTSRKAVKRG